MAYPHKWSPISYKSSAGQRKHIGQRPMLYRWTTPCKNWVVRYWHGSPLTSNRHHRSNGDCLEGKRENYQVCSVQYCAQQLCTMQCTHIWTDLTILWIGFCLTWPISLCFDSFVLLYIACVGLYQYQYLNLFSAPGLIVRHNRRLDSITWWGAPGGI